MNYLAGLLYALMINFDHATLYLFLGNVTVMDTNRVLFP